MVAYYARLTVGRDLRQQLQQQDEILLAVTAELEAIRAEEKRRDLLKGAKEPDEDDPDFVSIEMPADGKARLVPPDLEVRTEVYSGSWQFVPTRNYLNLDRKGKFPNTLGLLVQFTIDSKKRARA